ncbi:HAD family hydrolase [Pendulispora rubella]|uniref:D,D-heptose 1,7-bisphosphate phosphatase n=1 Tax=Pendulispora rubella TaxID=2741070 RepID=A0ABZ2KZT0_9BACT
MARRALFLDRDGTVIVDTGYPRDPRSVQLLDGAIAAMKEARDLGYALIVVSNQSGVARGIITPEQLASVHSRMVDLLAAEGVVLDGAYYCTHGPDDGCICRKPRPGLIVDAAREHQFDLAASLLVGDKASDVAAGEAAGCASFQLGTWVEALAWVRARSRGIGGRNG